jgi:hypothetical protein
MTSRTPKARIPIKAGERIVFSEEDFKAFERAYGRPLAPPVRGVIQLATENLRLTVPAETKAPDKRIFVAKIQRLKTAILSLLQAANLSIDEPVQWKTFDTMAEQTAAVIKESADDYSQFLLVVHMQVAACDLMLRKLEGDTGLLPGSAWTAFVQVITEVLQYSGLPVEVRKDADKRDTDMVNSAFVRLIVALHERIPKHLRPVNSKDALSQAIYRARQKRWPEILQPFLKQKFADFLQTPEECDRQRDEFAQRLRTDSTWVETRPGSFVRKELVTAGLAANASRKVRSNEAKESKQSTHLVKKSRTKLSGRRRLARRKMNKQKAR